MGNLVEILCSSERKSSGSKSYQIDTPYTPTTSTHYENTLTCCSWLFLFEPEFYLLIKIYTLNNTTQKAESIGAKVKRSLRLVQYHFQGSLDSIWIVNISCLINPEAHFKSHNSYIPHLSPWKLHFVYTLHLLKKKLILHVKTMRLSSTHLESNKK